ncbi:MAG: GTP cyclohydrolase I FolE2 [Alcaligenaceae bacterium]|jgi:GTP cyclohydrolase I|nr:GTP cyclohydrolase I FolE2 [Alcaligenaceae bacterium]
MKLTESNTPVMPDVQGSTDLRRIQINRVGVRQVKHPISVKNGQGDILGTVGVWDTAVMLPASEKGTHMSRFMGLIDEYHAQGMDAKLFKQMAAAMLPLLNADEGEIRVTFPYFITKKAPVSGVTSMMDYEVTWTAFANKDGVRFLTEVVVPVMSLCPCSKAISDYGAHNQRSHVTVQIETTEDFVLDDFIRAIEEQGSSQLWALLKRPDEKYVTEFSYDNPKFVEDLIRDVAIRVKQWPGLVAYRVEVENFESIHNHSAYAVLEGTA